MTLNRRTIVIIYDRYLPFFLILLSLLLHSDVRTKNTTSIPGRLINTTMIDTCIQKHRREIETKIETSEKAQTKLTWQILHE
jgi:hypothetical protein